MLLTIFPISPIPTSISTTLGILLQAMPLGIKKPIQGQGSFDYYNNGINELYPKRNLGLTLPFSGVQNTSHQLIKHTEGNNGMLLTFS